MIERSNSGFLFSSKKGISILGYSFPSMYNSTSLDYFKDFLYSKNG